MPTPDSAQENEILRALTEPNSEVIERLWPNDRGSGTVQEALTESGDGQLFESLMLHLRLMDSTLPVVAVLGLLNAGKSSTVGTFLSQAGKQRVLRGLSSNQATQRFVLWCPRTWNDKDRYQSLTSALTIIFGASLEPLQEDPLAAHMQYNSQVKGEFGIPLLAFDEGLDKVGFAILDCPDVERKLPGEAGDHTRSKRLDVLKKASSIASAMLIVATQSGWEKEEFEELIHTVSENMPGIPWWLLLNMCRVQYEPHALCVEVSSLTDKYNPQGVFAAYDYELNAEDWRSRTPAQIHAMGDGDVFNRQPAYYQLDQNPAKNPPNEVEQNRLLDSLPERLRGGDQLGQRLRITHVAGLGRQLHNAQTQLERHCAESKRKINQRWEELRNICVKGYLDDNKQLVAPLTPDTAARLKKAFVDTAPWHTRLALIASLGLGKVMGWAKAGPQWVLDQCNTWLGKKSATNSPHFAAGIDAHTFVDKMVNEGFALLEIPTEDERLEIWKKILERHRNHQPEQLNDEELKKAMKEVWDLGGGSVKALSLAGPLVLVLILIAFAMAATDGGVALAAVLTKLGMPAAFTLNVAGAALAYQVVGFLSVSEILIALGATVMLAPVGGYLLENVMRDRLSLPALADLFACACDAFGLPRKLDGKPIEVTINEKKYPLPAAKADPGAVEHSVCKASLWMVKPEGWAQLHKQVQKLSQAADHSSRN